MSDASERHEDLLDEAERLIAELSAHADPSVREGLERLLEGIDAVHRTGLTRLVAGIHGMAGEAFLHRLCSDPAVRLLLMSYDLVAVDRRLLTEEALDPVRAHLHAHGIDIELADVVGGVVYVRLHPQPEDEERVHRIARDLEAALEVGLPGFQELEFGDRHARPSSLVQLGGYRPRRRPVYRRAASVAEVPDAGMHPVDVEGTALLLIRAEGEIYAVADRCGESPLPLAFSALDGSTLTCSWHGCRYDVRTGNRVDGGPDRLEVFPLRIQGDTIEVAVATEPVEAEASGP